MSNNARTLFLRAVEEVAPEQWPQFLDRECGADAELRAKVSRLLEAQQHAGAFMERPAGPTIEFPTDESPADELIGAKIGPYKLREQIGEGGFGVVYVAEQTEPVRRKVALKVIKPGMDSKEVIARFEAERQALALMEHPSIAKVLDAGATDAGRPYFVMELIRGIPITRYCDENQLSTRERLQLFRQVAQAVQHAHQKGVIHRDIKPSNVLVTLRDGTPMPKVIDFGVAKAINQRLTERSIYTRFEQMIGTPLYMSPEQAELSEFDIDTRSDVYSLGVLLYELLTGTTPIERETLDAVGYDEIRRIIREEEPPRPSTRVSTLGQALTTISAARKCDAQKLSGLLHGELDWIVMKALDKDRNRRYESASAFAADVERYLNDEPVEACPPSVGYRIKKFAQRRKGLLTTVVLVSLSLVLGTAISIWQAIDAEGARQQAQTNFEEADRQRQEAERQRRLANERLKQSDANYQRALTAVDQMLKRVGGRDLMVVPQMLPVQRRLLEDAVTFFEEMIVERPTDPAVRHSAARAYLVLVSLYNLAGEADKRRSAGERSVELLETLAVQFPTEPEYRAALAVSYSYLARCLDSDSEQEAMYRKAVETAESLVADHPKHSSALARTSAALASYLTNSHPKEAEQLFRRVLNLQGGSDANTALLLGKLLITNKEFDEAEILLRNATSTYKERLQKHPDYTLNRELRENLSAAHHNLGTLYAQTKRVDAAKQEYLQAVETARKLSNEFPLLWGYRNRYTQSYSAYVQFLESRGHSAEAAEFLRTEASWLNPRTAAQFVVRAELHRRVGEIPKALADLSKCLDLDPNNAQAYSMRAKLYQDLGEATKAMADYNKYVELSRNSAQARFARGEFYLNQLKDYEKALLDLNVAIEQRPSIAYWYKRRALAHFRLGHFDEALTDLGKAVELRPNDITNLTWIPTNLVAQCPDGRFCEGMLALADRTIKLTDGSGAAYAARATLLETLGHAEQASADYERLLTLEDPESASTCNSAAWLLARTPAHSRDMSLRAVSLAEKAVALKPKVGSYWNTLGVAQYRAGKWDDAIKALEKSDHSTLGETHSYDAFFLAMAHWQLDHRSEALEWYGKGVEWMHKHKPDDEDIQRFQAEAAELLGAPAITRKPESIDTSED